MEIVCTFTYLIKLKNCSALSNGTFKVAQPQFQWAEDSNAKGPRTDPNAMYWLFSSLT